MSERIPGGEHHELIKMPEEALVEYDAEKVSNKPEAVIDKKERQKQNLEYLKKQAEAYADSRENLAPDNAEKKPEEKHIGQHQMEKADNYEQTLRHLRSKLKPIERPLSRFIHKPAIDKISELAGRTVARPSAILGGGLAGLAGSAVFLFAAKRYGFEYNFFVFIGLFMLGYFLGVIAEFLIKAVKQTRH